MSSWSSSNNRAARRVLIACPAPLQPEYGAAQMALNLAGALRARGHHVDLWSPAPGPWWSRHRRMRHELDAYLVAHERYDVIDAPSYLVTAAAARSATVVARSVQPDAHYLFAEWLHELRRAARPNAGWRAVLRILARSIAYAAYDLWWICLMLRGWMRARYVLSLGSLEHEWMRRRLPMLRAKLHWYVNALAPAEQERLREVHRTRHPRDGSTRFLWIGRWSAHKGTERLLRFLEARAVTHPGDRVTIAGCGTIPDVDASRLASIPTVRVVPRFKRDALYEMLASHDAGLFTSEVEGWGLVLNEMIESGLPVYAVASGGVPDLRRYGADIRHFPPRDEPIAPATPPRADYFRDCSWAAIAASYDRAFVAPASGERTLPECHSSRPHPAASRAC